MSDDDLAAEIERLQHWKWDLQNDLIETRKYIYQLRKEKDAEIRLLRAALQEIAAFDAVEDSDADMDGVAASAIAIAKIALHLS